MKLAYWLVGIVFVLLPWAVMVNAVPLLSMLVLALIVMAKKDKKGVSFVIIAIGLCLPFFSRIDDTTKLFFAIHFSWLNRAIYISAIFLFIIYLNKKKRPIDRFFPSSLLKLISVCFVIECLRFGFSEAISSLFILLTIPIMYYICYKGHEGWNDVFYMFTLFFICLSVYAILDFFFMIGPYVPLRKGFVFFDEFFRTGSLLGNSLSFTAFLMAYHTILFIDTYLTGKFHYLLISASILITMLTGSRTAFLVLVAVWVMFIVYLNREIKGHGRIVGIMLIVALLLVGVVSFFWGEYITMYVDRFSEGSDHRASGFQTTINIFMTNPTGLGYVGIGDMLELYAGDGWSAGMKTVDNMFLTFIITSGIFFFIPFLFYFYIPLNALFRSRGNPNYRIVVMFFIPYVLCGMSFNVNSLIQLNILYFGIVGHMYRIIQNKQIYGLVNNNS